MTGRPSTAVSGPPETADFRIFTWLMPPVLPDKNLIVIPRADDLMFGILQSKFHTAWAVRKGSDLRISPRYTHTSTFGTFPFPEGYAPSDPLPNLEMDAAASDVSRQAATLYERREKWLNPPEHVEVATEKFGLGTRFVPRTPESAKVLYTRTLTELYKLNPPWLQQTNEALDKAVARLYGWPENITSGDALIKLLELNMARGRIDTRHNSGATLHGSAAYYFASDMFV